MPEVLLTAGAFGRELIVSRDLDPVYVILWEARMQHWKLRDWLVAYGCFYHVGTAGWIVDQPDYWKAMMTAAQSSDFPRSTERRHFRGRNAAAAVRWLSEVGVDKLLDPFFYGPMTVEEVVAVITKWPQFGPWIAFKIADMLERLDITPVVFPPGALAFYASPLAGAQRMWEEEGKERGEAGVPADVTTWAVDTLGAVLGDLPAPPRYERPVNVQEIETVLCKWNTYRKGHYHLGEDIEACRHGLLRSRFTSTPTAATLYRAGREAKLW